MVDGGEQALSALSPIVATTIAMLPVIWFCRINCEWCFDMGALSQFERGVKLYIKEVVHAYLQFSAYFFHVLQKTAQHLPDVSNKARTIHRGYLYCTYQ